MNENPAVATLKHHCDQGKHNVPAGELATQAKVAINFIGGSKQDKWLVTCPPRCIKDVECSAQIHFEIQSRIDHGSRHSYLGREVVDFSGAIHHAFNQRPVPHITNGDAQAVRASR